MEAMMRKQLGDLAFGGQLLRHSFVGGMRSPGHQTKHAQLPITATRMTWMTGLAQDFVAALQPGGASKSRVTGEVNDGSSSRVMAEKEV